MKVGLRLQEPHPRVVLSYIQVVKIHIMEMEFFKIRGEKRWGEDIKVNHLWRILEGNSFPSHNHKSHWPSLDNRIEFNILLMHLSSCVIWPRLRLTFLSFCPILYNVPLISRWSLLPKHLVSPISAFFYHLFSPGNIVLYLSPQSPITLSNCFPSFNPKPFFLAELIVVGLNVLIWTLSK